MPGSPRLSVSSGTATTPSRRWTSDDTSSSDANESVKIAGTRSASMRRASDSTSAGLALARVDVPGRTVPVREKP